MRTRWMRDALAAAGGDGRRVRDGAPGEGREGGDHGEVVPERVGEGVEAGQRLERRREQVVRARVADRREGAERAEAVLPLLEEPRHGDETRSFEPFVERNGARESAYYFACNRGKGAASSPSCLRASVPADITSTIMSAI